MTPAQIAAAVSMLEQAAVVGTKIVVGVKALLHHNLTKEENEQVLAVWEDNVRRSAANAGLDSGA